MKKFICFLLASSLIFTACGSRLGKDSEESAESELEISQAESISEPEPEQNPSSGESATGAEASEDDEPTPPLTFTLTIPEGYTLARIGMTLEEMDVCTADEFIAASQEGDFSDYPLVAEQAENPNRCFKLEGYLFPDTYDIYYSNTPDEIIRRLLDHTEQIINSDLRAEIAASGYTVDEILAMASIIEKESFGEEHMANISSVLHNRLDINMRLQCDVTITYVEGAIKPFISGDKDRYNSYYNTFKCPALPAGPICNPGIAAIKAALRPADTNYFYFVTDSEKNYLFAETWEDHEANVAVALG